MPSLKRARTEEVPALHDAGKDAADECDYVLVLPDDLPPPAPGELLRLTRLDSDAPRLQVGALALVGQHQRTIGTAVLFSLPGVGSAQRPRLELLVERRIVFKLVAAHGVSGDGACAGEDGGGTSNAAVGTGVGGWEAEHAH